MRAFKLQVQVSKDRILKIMLPDDVGEGPAEVLVLLAEQSATRQAHTLEEYLHRLSAKHRNVKSQEEIDLFLEEERRSWE